MAVAMREEGDEMRIEGTYTFPAAIERVFAALTEPDTLRQALPGCERLIQLGPAAPDGAATFEVRLRPAPDAGIYTLRITGVVSRRPAHLRLELRGRGPHGPVRGSGLIDLVAQDEFTVGAYVFDLMFDPAAAGAATAESRVAQLGGQRYARTVCERLADVLRPERPSDGAAEVVEPRRAARMRVVARGVRTPQGRILALPAASSGSPLSANANAWIERIGWMATGMVMGMAALGLLVAITRWLGDWSE